MPQFRQYPQANNLQPTDAFVIDREGVGTLYIEGGDFTTILTPGTYGDSTDVAQIVVGPGGNIVSITNVAIEGGGTSAAFFQFFEVD